jgi:hypothetical protein
MGNTINTLQSNMTNGRINFKVRSDDFGANNAATVRVFDKNGFVKDVPLKFERKVGSDDVFTGSLDVAALPAGMRPELLEMTSYVTIGNVTLWEGKNTPIQSRLIDAQLDSPALVAPTRTLTKRTTSVETDSGKLELTWRTQELQGYKDASGREHLTDIKFVPNGRGPLDKNASELQVLVTPRMELQDKGPGRNDFVVKTVEDYNKQNYVTVKRQADGTYTAAAEPGKSFVAAQESRVYMGGTANLDSVQVALADQAGHWDSRQGENYSMDLLREGWPTEIESLVDGVSGKIVSDCAVALYNEFRPALATNNLSYVRAAYENLAAAYPTAITTPSIQREFITRLATEFDGNQQLSPDLVRLVLDQVKPGPSVSLRPLMESVGRSSNVSVARATANWAKANGRTDEIPWMLKSAARDGKGAGVISALVRNYALPTAALDEAINMTAHGNNVPALKVLLGSGKTSSPKRDEALGMAGFLGHIDYVKTMLAKGSITQDGLNQSLVYANRSISANKAAIIALLVAAGAQ